MGIQRKEEDSLPILPAYPSVLVCVNGDCVYTYISPINSCDGKNEYKWNHDNYYFNLLIGLDETRKVGKHV